MRRISPFQLMNTVFLGLGASFIYSLLSSTLLWGIEGKSAAQSFLFAYNIQFKTLIALGLIIGTALVVFRSQSVIPHTIRMAFKQEDLEKTRYEFYERRFRNWRRSATFAAIFFFVAFGIFSFSRFPLQGLAEALMIIPACLQYALGVYVGRKLFYAAMMVHSLLDVPVTRNLFKKRELDDINAYVHITSTLMIIFGYVHLIGYTEGPFLFQSDLGQSVKIFLFLPAFIGTPVLLIFNFYPRFVLRRLYDWSIDVEVEKLKETIQSEKLSHFEKESYLLEFDRISREELRYSLQLTLGDLPIGITILVMVLEPLLGK